MYANARHFSFLNRAFCKISPCSKVMSLGLFNSPSRVSSRCITDVSMIRNVAIIAHVDHGKTSLVDQMLRQSGVVVKDQERVMDSNDLEKERGITILSKSTAIEYKGYRINIVDTPGHADFGGEVERVLSMADGVCLVCCATEGPMTQTKFVLTKALNRNLKPLVVMNKVDRDSARPEAVENELLELFIGLDANEDQLDYPVIYASAREGWATLDINQKSTTIYPLLDQIIKYVPAPNVDTAAPFSLLVTVLFHLSSKLKTILMLENATWAKFSLEKSRLATR